MASTLFRRTRPEPIDTKEHGRASDTLASSPFGASVGSTAFGFSIPEYNMKLVGRSGTLIYDEMRRSSSHVRSSLRMMFAPVLTAQWYMAPASPNKFDTEIAKFAWWSLNRMDRTFQMLLREALNSLTFGYYPFELMWELAEWTPPYGPDERKPVARTVATWADWIPLHPIRIYGYDYDSNNRISALKYGNMGTKIEWDKIAHFSFESEGDDPQGMSVLRSAYQDWWYVQQFYKIDAIQKERHGIGIPDIEWQPGATTEDKTLGQELGRNLRANESAYVLRPSTLKVGFIQPQGHLVDVLASAQHHTLGIQTSMLTQYLSLGTQESGSRAVGVTLGEAFADSTRYVTDFVRGVINMKLRELIDKNYSTDEYPELRARRFDEARLRALSVGYQNLVNARILSPTPDDEVWVRDYLDLPPADADALNRKMEDRVYGPGATREDIRANTGPPPGSGLPPLSAGQGTGSAGKPTE